MQSNVHPFVEAYYIDEPWIKIFHKGRFVPTGPVCVGVWLSTRDGDMRMELFLTEGR